MNRWSNRVTSKVKRSEKPTPCTFKKNANAIVKELMYKSEGDPVTALRKIQFYINRAGSNLTNKVQIKKAKKIIESKTKSRDVGKNSTVWGKLIEYGKGRKHKYYYISVNYADYTGWNYNVYYLFNTKTEARKYFKKIKEKYPQENNLFHLDGFDKSIKEITNEKNPKIIDLRKGKTVGYMADFFDGEKPEERKPKAERVLKKDDDLFGDIIYAYTRKEAIRDGLQVLVPKKLSEEAGFKFPVYLNSSVYNIVEQAINNKKWMNDLEGVLWDILYMMRLKIKSSKQENNILFQVIITGTGRKRNHIFKAVIGANDIDDPSPAITVMMPDED